MENNSALDSLFSNNFLKDRILKAVTKKLISSNINQVLLFVTPEKNIDAIIVKNEEPLIQLKETEQVILKERAEFYEKFFQLNRMNENIIFPETIKKEDEQFIK